ncbi:hypothetical protein [Paraurantiacibacter namhicola]|uniref:Lipopolysaccharide assembly protein A domain-containing protein n=1 Tax=Paraurantiacibacter namhicola TaxID=645517 RepID=A0A1C7D8G1_9SPHN|nr:hypothetical protein [Paraurantiacibacter namhicola]ANU07738.1 hypothetical protein A6F65_01433 [Paraurantiacibacter namhicola]
MAVFRTIVWALLLAALLLFSVYNWTDVEVRIWEGLLLQTKIPALVIVSFLAGLLPMWLLHRGKSWHYNRKIRTLESQTRNASVGTATGSTDAITPSSVTAREATPPSPSSSDKPTTVTTSAPQPESDKLRPDETTP